MAIAIGANCPWMPPANTDSRPSGQDITPTAVTFASTSTTWSPPPGHKTLVTQLYFASDPAFEGDPQKNFSRDLVIRTPELIRPVLLTGEPEAIHAEVRFELCLERL